MLKYFFWYPTLFIYIIHIYVSFKIKMKVIKCLCNCIFIKMWNFVQIVQNFFQGWFFVSYLIDFSYFLLDRNCQKITGHSQNRSKMDHFKVFQPFLNVFQLFYFLARINPVFSYKVHSSTNKPTNLCYTICTKVD